MKYEQSNGVRTDAVIDTFGGLDRSRALCGGKESFELCNLRLMADGSLSRRPGLCPVATFDGEVRGAACVTRGGQEEWYVVAGETVCYLAREQGAYHPEVIGTLTTHSGEVSFLCHDGALLLLDGAELYTLTPAEAKAMEAYVPLYGKEWESGDASTHVMYEAPSVLTNRLRLQYRMSETGKTITLTALAPESVDALWINGVRYRGNFSYGALTKVIATGTEIEKGSLVEVYLTMPDGGRGHITSARRMAAMDRAERPRVMFYDIPDEGRVWISRLPDVTSLATLRDMIPTVCLLYVTAADLVTVGDGVHRVTGAVRHYDRSLVFTACGTWMTMGEQNEDGTLRFIPVNTTLGCSVAGGALVLGNTPITICQQHVLAWNSDTDERNECNASPISTPVEVFLKESRGNWSAFADAQGGDAWIYRPGEKGRILLYQSERGAWTSYDGFSPQCMALMGGKVTVGIGKVLYLLDEAETADTLVSDEHPEGMRVGIKAKYQSAFLDFDTSDRIKRLCRGTVVASCGKGEMTLTLQSVSGRSVHLDLKGDGEEVSVMQVRAPMGRFRFLRVGAASEDDAPLRLHRIRLSARHS